MLSATWWPFSLGHNVLKKSSPEVHLSDRSLVSLSCTQDFYYMEQMESSWKKVLHMCMKKNHEKKIIYPLTVILSGQLP